MAGMAERVVECHALAGPEPVQKDREIVDTDLGLGGLQKTLGGCGMQPIDANAE
jgi:hypothetical protein